MLNAEIDFVHELVRYAAWSMAYHKHELAKAHREAAGIKAVIVRCFPEIDVARVRPVSSDDCDQNDAGSPGEYVLCTARAK